MYDLLAETVAIPEARDWLLDRKITPDNVGLGLMESTRAYLESLPPRALAEYLIGGLSVAPNTLYTRDTTSWIYDKNIPSFVVWQLVMPPMILIALLQQPVGYTKR